MRISFPAVLLGSLLATTVAMADSVPKYDMARTCRLDHAAASGLAVSESMAFWQRHHNAFAPKRHDFAVEERCLSGDDRDVYRALPRAVVRRVRELSIMLTSICGNRCA